MTLDIDKIRAQFPILKRKINNNRLVYLDSAASAQKPDFVIDAMANFTRNSYANVHRGLHTLSNEATNEYENTRQNVAKFINANEDEVIFTKGATEALNLLAYSLGQGLAAGDEIIITELEHHANIVPWQMLCARNGAVLKWAKIDDDGQIDLEDFEKLLNAKTKIVSIAHISNVLGTRLPIEQIIKMAKNFGALVIIDGSQGIVHEKIDVKTLDCDFYTFSSHKLYGPTSLGVLYGKIDLLNQMPPFLGGGEMIEKVTKDGVTFNQAPFRFEAGTPPIIEAIGLSAAINWLSNFDRNEIIKHENELLKLANDGLSTKNNIKIHGTTKNKAAILTFSIDNIHPHDISQILDKYGVAIRAGHHCAQPLMARLGVSASARASFGIYNNKEDVIQFLNAIDKAIEFLS